MSLEPKIEVRSAERRDLGRIVEIYNHYVVHTHITFDLEPFTIEQRAEWFSHYAAHGPHRLFVATENDRVLGYASSSVYRPKPGYATSIETSVYVDRDHPRRGIASALYGTLFEALEGEDLHRAYAGIALPNDASLALHERFRFRRVAHFTEQGRKHGRYWDVVWLERSMDSM